MESNQQIVVSWLKSKEFFVVEEIFYGQHNHDIDILAVDLRSNIIYDIEVKFRKNTKIHSNIYSAVVDNFADTDRDQAIIKYFGENFNNYTIEKCFITNKSLLGKDSNRIKWEQGFAIQGISVKYLEDILQELKQKVAVVTKTNDTVLQLLRIMN